MINLLLLEPDRDLREILMETLKEETCYNILETGTLEGVEKIIENHKINILVSDCSSLGVNGIAVLALILGKGHPLRKTILTSSFPSDNMTRSARTLLKVKKIKAVLIKPFSVQDLLDALNN